MIREDEPPQPSTRISTLGDELPGDRAAGATRSRGRSARMLRGDLDWIVMKALEKDRTRRYATATALADDIARHLHDEPVLAGPPTPAYRLRKFVQRHRVGASAAAVILVALVGGLWVSIAATREARRQADLARTAEAEAASQRDAATLARTEEAEQRLRAEKGEAEAQREAKRASTALGLITRALRSADPNQTKSPNYTVQELLDDVAADLGDELADDPDLEAALRGTIGVAYLGLGLAREAEPHLARALALHREQLGDDHPTTVRDRSNWGWILYRKAEYPEAAEVAREVHEAVVRQHGADSSEALETQTVLASRLVPLNRFDEAERLLRRAASVAQRHPSLTVSKSLGIADALAVVLNARGADPEAERVLRDAISAVTDAEEELGPSEAGALSLARSRLVDVLVKQGKYPEARAQAEEGLRRYRRRLGEEHRNTLYAEAYLAQVDWAEGRWDDAARRYEAVLSALRRRGESGMGFWRLLNGYALVLQGRGDHASALALLEEAVRGAGEGLGEDHPYVAALVSTLAVTHAKLGDLAKAEESQGRALRIYERTVGKDNSGYITGLNNLASFLAAGGQYVKAEPLDQEALQRSKRVLGEEHPLTARVQINLAHSLTELGHIEEAQKHLEQGVKILSATLPDHSDLARGLNNLGDLYRRLGRSEDAVEALRESVRFSKARLGPRHASLVPALGNLAHACSDVGREDEARALFAEAVDIAREAWGPDSPALMTILLNLGEFEESRGDYAEAEQHQREVLRLAALHPRYERGTVACAHHYLGRILRRRGELEEGEPHLQEAVELAGAVYGPLGLPTVLASAELADLARAKGEVERAIAELESLRAQVRDRYPPGNVVHPMVLRHLSLAYRDGGRMREAIEAMEAASTALQSTRPGSTGVMYVLGDLADLLQQDGRTAEAAVRYEEAVALARKLSLERTPRTATWQWRLGGCLAVEGDHERAIAHLSASLVVFREVLPAGHPYTASALATLGWALVETGEYADAEAPLREALEIRRKSWPDHFLTWNTMSLLGASLAGLARYEEAEPLLVDGYENMQVPDSPVWKERKEVARQRIVALYEAWDEPEKAAAWKDGQAVSEAAAPAEPEPVGAK